MNSTSHRRHGRQHHRDHRLRGRPGRTSASSPAATQAQANAHARAVMASCVREHPPVSLAALQAQVTCAVPPGYRKAAAQCITLGVRGARDAFTTRRQITQVYAEECMAGNW